MKKDIQKILEIPEGVNVKISEGEIIVKGPLGECNRKILPHEEVEIKIDGNKIIMKKEKATKKEKKIINSLAAHLRNMMQGVRKKYEYVLEICSVHFPMNVKIEKNEIVIKNFFGERKDRIVKIIPNVEVEIQGNKIFVRSVDKELAGRQASLIESISRNIPRDRRIFQDGIWIIKKEKGAKK